MSHLDNDILVTVTAGLACMAYLFRRQATLFLILALVVSTDPAGLNRNPTILIRVLTAYDPFPCLRTSRWLTTCVVLKCFDEPRNPVPIHPSLQ